MFVLFIMFEDVSSIKSLICYFIFQVYGRLLFIYGFIRSSFILLSFLGLSVKFGLFPFHIWQPYVFNFVNWKTCFILAGPQKAFLILIFVFLNFQINDFIVAMISLTIIIANLCLILVYDLKKTFAFLSIGRAAWLLCLVAWSMETRIWFLVLYNLQLIIIFIVFLVCEIYVLERKKYLNLLILIFIVSYSGVPPIIGFFIKLQILNFFFFWYQNIIFLLLFRIIIIPSTFFLIYYSIIFFLKKKLIIVSNISFFYIISILMFFILPYFYIVM